MNYSSLQQKALDLLTTHGAAITIRISTKGTYNSATDSYTITTTDYSTYGVIEEYKLKEIDGELIKVGDKKLMVGINSTLPELTNLMDILIVIGTDVWKSIKVNPIKPANIIVYYEIQIRKVQ